jgi:WD40 repeat protein
VNRVIQLHDGRLASCSSDYTIRIWNVDSGQCVNIIVGYYRLEFISPSDRQEIAFALTSYLIPELTNIVIDYL